MRSIYKDKHFECIEEFEMAREFLLNEIIELMERGIEVHRANGFLEEFPDLEIDKRKIQFELSYSPCREEMPHIIFLHIPYKPFLEQEKRVEFEILYELYESDMRGYVSCLRDGVDTNSKYKEHRYFMEVLDDCNHLDCLLHDGLVQSIRN